MGIKGSDPFILILGARGYVKTDAYSVGCALVYLYAVFQPAGKDVESAGLRGHFNFRCGE